MSVAGRQGKSEIRLVSQPTSQDQQGRARNPYFFNLAQTGTSTSGLSLNENTPTPMGKDYGVRAPGEAAQDN